MYEEGKDFKRQKATRIPNNVSPTVGPSGTKKQTTAKGDLWEDGGEGPERKRSLLKNDGELFYCLKRQTAQKGLSEPTLPPLIYIRPNLIISILGPPQTTLGRTYLKDFKWTYLCK
ncbi:hypothetical protein ElyMa_000188200 [Elysia marginata]|uniref:Uncharacterized protein n=1 Tax=Elysia marginata TaxID=1093978 RepID=A0AAV4EWM0_9GAST|nr:hypothetical protein ElyMa_000188200 [Elysia marginata]